MTFGVNPTRGFINMENTGILEMAKTDKASAKGKRSREDWAEIFEYAAQHNESNQQIADRIGSSANNVAVMRSRLKKASNGVKRAKFPKVTQGHNPVDSNAAGSATNTPRDGGFTVEVRSARGTVVTFNGTMPDYELLRRLLTED